MAIDIGKIIESVRKEDYTILRQVNPGITEEEMIQVFQAVGNEFNPGYVIDKENRNCILNMMKWLFGDKTLKAINPATKTAMNGRFRNTGIYLYGTTGTGKTLAVRILSQVAKSFGVKYQSNRQEFPLKWQTYRADELVDKYIHGDSLTEIKETPILCINDLGSEVTEALYMGTRMNVLRNLIEQRGESTRYMTIFTSNIPLDSPDLARLYGDRAVSRLVAMTNFMQMRGPDRRRQF